MYFVLNVYGEEPSIDFCAVEITPEYAALLLKRIWLVNFLKAEDHAVDHVQYWDASGCWLGADSFEDTNLDDETFLEKLNDDLAGEHAKLLVDFSFSDTLDRRTECDRATVKTSGVFWRCYPKHGDIEVTTAEITVEQLQEVVRDEESIRNDECGISALLNV